jgi:sugar lactone lactonase YvrE
VAAADGDVYWEEPSAIVWVGAQGGAGSALDPPSSALPAPGPSGLAVDDTGVYWVGSGIFHAPPGGGTVTTLAPAPSGATGLAIDAANVYWCGDVSQSYALQITPKAGGTTRVLVPDQFGATFFATDGQNVYWTTGLGDGSVFKVPVAGGSPVTLTSSTGQVAPLALDDTSVYWANGDGSVMRLTPK